MYKLNSFKLRINKQREQVGSISLAQSLERIFSCNNRIDPQDSALRAALLIHCALLLHRTNKPLGFQLSLIYVKYVLLGTVCIVEIHRIAVDSLSSLIPTHQTQITSLTATSSPVLTSLPKK